MRRTLPMLLLALVACGSSGAKPGDGGAPDAAHACGDLPNLYAQAIDEARRCDPDGGRNECQVVVKANLLCGCQTIVNDATTVHALEAEFETQDCRSQPPFQATPCLAGCLAESSRTCVAVDGGGICQLPSP